MASSNCSPGPVVRHSQDDDLDNIHNNDTAALPSGDFRVEKPPSEAPENTDTACSEDLRNFKQMLEEMQFSHNKKELSSPKILSQSRFFVGPQSKCRTVDMVPTQQSPSLLPPPPLSLLTSQQQQPASSLHQPPAEEDLLDTANWLQASRWGWFVVLGSFLFMSFVDGICFSYGLLVDEVNSYFELKYQSPWAMVPGSLLTGMYILTGPLANLFANSLNYRQVASLGTVIATLAIFVAAFLRDFASFVLLFGVVAGIGFGFIYLPAIAIVGIWFQQRRALAVGLALCGSGIGTLLFGQSTPWALQSMTLYELLLAWAAVSAQCLIAVVAFRPLDVHYKILSLEAANKKLLKDTKKKPVKPRRIIIKRSRIMQRIIDDKEKQKKFSQGSLDGMIITRDNQLIACASEHCIKPILSEAAIHRIVDNIMRRHFTSDKLPVVSRNETVENMTAYVQTYVSQMSLQSLTACNCLRQQQQPPPVPADALLHSNIKSDIAMEVMKECNFPLFRRNRFCSSNLLQQKSCSTLAPGCEAYLETGSGGLHTSTTGTPPGAPPSSMSFLREMFNYHLLSSPTFIVLMIACMLSMLGFFVPFHYLPVFQSQSLGLTASGHIVSAMGLFNTLGRLLSTAYIENNVNAGCAKLDCLWLHNAALLLAAGAALLMIFCQQHFIFTFFLAAIYSLCMASFISLKSILVVELFGIQRLTNAFSFLLIFQGACVALSSPLAVMLKHTMSSDAAPFYFAGGCIALSALFHMPLRLIADLERQWWERYLEKNQNLPTEWQSGERYAASGRTAGSVSAPLLQSLQSGHWHVTRNREALSEHQPNCPWKNIALDRDVEEC